MNYFTNKIKHTKYSWLMCFVAKAITNCYTSFYILLSISVLISYLIQSNKKQFADQNQSRKYTLKSTSTHNGTRERRPWSQPWDTFNSRVGGAEGCSLKESEAIPTLNGWAHRQEIIICIYEWSVSNRYKKKASSFLPGTRSSSHRWHIWRNTPASVIRPHKHFNLIMEDAI